MYISFSRRKAVHGMVDPAQESGPGVDEQPCLPRNIPVSLGPTVSAGINRGKGLIIITAAKVECRR